MGGLARRATWLKEFHEKYGGPPAFQVDAGGLFAFRKPDAERQRVLMEASARFGVDIVNLTPADAHQLHQMVLLRWKTPGAAPKPPDPSQINIPWLAGQEKQPQLISANVQGPDGKPLVAPYAVRRGADGSRIVFIGLTSTPKHEWFGYKLEEPRETLARLLPSVRDRADLIVLLAYMPNSDVLDIATAFPAVDVIVSAYEHQLAASPYQIGGAWVLQAPYEGKMIGAVGLQVSAARKLERLEPGHIVGLDASFADDPEIAALVAGAKKPGSVASGPAAHGARQTQNAR